MSHYTFDEKALESDEEIDKEVVDDKNTKES